MTINIGLVTSEAVVLGCDSVASTTGYFLDPFSRLVLDKDGNPKLDDKGKLIAQFEMSEIEEVVTNAWGGVTKMFEIHPNPSPVAAVTSGLAKLNERTISSIAADFFQKQSGREPKLVSVRSISNAFLRYMRKEYETHYKNTNIPEQLRTGPEFLVGGIGRDDKFPSLYRLRVRENRLEDTNMKDGKGGLAWAGQSDGVERLAIGCDSPLRDMVEAKVKEAIDKNHSLMAGAFANILQRVLDYFGDELPKSINTNLPKKIGAQIPWDNLQLDVDFANMPLQSAIDFAGFMVTTQAGKSRFVRGVATVGGRTHIGIIRKNKGFELLNEPTLVHRHTGFEDV